MHRSKKSTESGDLVSIARDTSLFDWLFTVSKARRHPEPLPRQLRVDLGLPPLPRDGNWPVWR